ncbi:DUF6470 family protein [Metabacillus endolithicus]|uniref:DUF6470 family protein n=1 Tax=Metabacillus endolithicus TaxID=1535204 RepID=A0ABW5C0M0_9BACI|nr:DUF6470 family protein [Metabacillus endolithicus]UPG65367.1 DUF6470 family protein [Metabacillus endolithicus]
MKIPQIRLESTNAQISIETRNAVNNIEQPKADLSIEQPKAELMMKTTPSKLMIDTYEARADMDLKSVSRRMEEFAHKGYQDLLAGVARRAKQGEELMKIEQKSNPIANQAKLNSQKPMKEFGLVFIPSAGSVKVQYEPSKVDIDINQRKPIINVQVNKPIFQYEPGKVNIGLEKRNDLKIDFETIDIKA